MATPLLITREGFDQIFPGSIERVPGTDYRFQLVNRDLELAAAGPLWDLDPEDIVGTYEVTAVDRTATRGHRPPLALWALTDTSTWDEVLTDHPEYIDLSDRDWNRPSLTSGVSPVELVSSARAAELGLTTSGQTPVGSYLPCGADWTYLPRPNIRPLPQPIELFDHSTLASA